MEGYYKNAEATAEVSRFSWHHTGDIGYLDGENFLYIVDRAKDMIITGGFNVYSIEVEQALLQHPDVMDSAVFGLPDAKWGERVAAVVQLHAGRVLTAEELMASSRRASAASKRPSKWISGPTCRVRRSEKSSRRKFAPKCSPIGRELNSETERPA